MIDKKLYLEKTRKILFGMFTEEEPFLETVRKVHDKRVEIIDCYTPYPVHGLDRAMGLVRSRLPIGAFIAGSTGFLCALALQFYTMAHDWPMVIGNKPPAGVSWVPVLFEMSVLFTAFGIALMFFTRSKMIHGKMPMELVTPRQTDDTLVIAISLDNPAVNVEELKQILFRGGAYRVMERTNHGYEDFTDVDIKNESGAAVTSSH